METYQLLRTALLENQKDIFQELLHNHDQENANEWTNPPLKKRILPKPPTLLNLLFQREETIPTHESDYLLPLLKTGYKVTEKDNLDNLTFALPPTLVVTILEHANFIDRHVLITFSESFAHDEHFLFYDISSFPFLGAFKRPNSMEFINALLFYFMESQFKKNNLKKFIPITKELLRASSKHTLLVLNQTLALPSYRQFYA